MRKKIVSALILVFILSAAFFFCEQKGNKPALSSEDLAGDGCTVVLVGKDASADGSTMTTHTADCGI